MNPELIARMVRGRCEPLSGSLAAAALVRVPSLCDGLPDLPLPPNDRPITFPVASSELLAPLVDRALRAAVDEALAEMRPIPAEELARRLQDDSLTRALSRLLEEGLGLSPGAGSLVALDYARACSSRFAAPTPLLVDGVRRVADLPPPARAAALRAVASTMSARLAVACAELAGVGLRVPSLVTMLTDTPLVWVLPHSTPLPIDLDLAVAALGSSEEDALMSAASVAFDHVVSGVLARVADRTLDARDASLSLRFCLPALQASGTRDALARLRGEPDAWTVVLPQLSGWVDDAGLVRAGVPAAAASELLRVDVAVAVASTIAQAARGWQAAQVVACVLAAIAPTGESSVSRQLLLPRGQPVHATVVAVSTGMIAAATSEQVALSREVTSLFAAWKEVTGAAAVSSLEGPIAWFVFTDAIAAVRFAATVGARSPTGLPPPAAAVATGPLSGGSDGEVLRLAGPAVQDALSLLAHLPLPGRPASFLGHKQIILDRGRLAGHAAALDGATLDLLRAAALTPVPGAVPPGVHAAWEFDGGVLVVVPIAELPDASAAVQMTFADWTVLASAASPPLSGAGAAPARPRPKPAQVAEAKPNAPAAPPAPQAPATEARPEALATEAKPEAQAAAGRPEGSHEVRRPKRAAVDDAPVSAPVRATVPMEPVHVPASAPVPAGNPFNDDAEPTSIPGPASPAREHVSSSNPFDDAFGIPVGDQKAPPPAAPPPAYFEGVAGFDIVTEASPPEEPGAAFALPEFSGEPSPVSAALVERKPKRAPVVDFNFLLAGYACYVERDRVVFGRPYGTRLVDMHAFDADGNLDRAYLAFVQAKIREGFVPQTELSGELPRTVTVMPLDLERLGVAWRALT